MWIFLNDCAFSIVAKDCARDELMVRARRPGDIEKLFPDAQVTEFTRSDYHYRAAVKRTALANALVAELARVTYSNFKNSVEDRRLHDAYSRVWGIMAGLQPSPPYSGRGDLRQADDGFFDFHTPKGAKPAAKSKKRSLKKGS